MMEETAKGMRVAAIQVYLFSRTLRRMARDAESELRARGVEPDPRIPILDQLAAYDARIAHRA